MDGLPPLPNGNEVWGTYAAGLLQDNGCLSKDMLTKNCMSLEMASCAKEIKLNNL